MQVPLSVFHGLSIAVLLTVLIAHFTVDGLSAMWRRAAQIGSWNLLTYTAFSVFSVFVDTRRVTERRLIFLDISFSVSVTTAAGVFLFYMLVVLPFTPQFRIDHDCHNTPSQDSCMSGPGLAVLTMVHVVPLVLSSFELVCVPHKYAFENIKVELSALVSYVAIFLLFSVLCYEYLHASPYVVQDLVSPSVSVVIYVFCLFFFVGVFFAVRWLHSKCWAESTKVHYTDQLLSSLEEQWGGVPASEAPEFNIQAFAGREGKRSGPEHFQIEFDETEGLVQHGADTSRRAEG